MDTILQKLQFLEIPINATDLTKPEPTIIQRIYRMFLVKAFGFNEASLTQSEFGWQTSEMTKDVDLFNRAEPVFILLRYIQCILSDSTGPEFPLFGLGDLIDPKPKSTRLFILQLLEMHSIRQMTQPLYDEVEGEVTAQVVEAERIENEAIEMEHRLDRMKGERDARIRMDNQLRETKEKRAQKLTEITKESEEVEARLESIETEEKKIQETIGAREDELTGVNRKSNELEYALIDDPDQLREEVEILRTRKADQQKLVDNETRECRELESREDYCRQAEKAINVVEGEISVASRIVSKLDGAMREMIDKEGVLEELQDQVTSKKDGVERNREERETFKQRHEDEKKEQITRHKSLASTISSIRDECHKLINLEGEVKKNVMDKRNKLIKLKNEKNISVQELEEQVKSKMELIDKVEKKLAEKMVILRNLEAAYTEGKENLREAMTTSDLDMSTTATATMQLLD